MSDMASSGHDDMQRPQPIHLSRSIRAVSLPPASPDVSSHDPITVGRGGIPVGIPKERFEIPVTDVRQGGDGLMAVTSKTGKTFRWGELLPHRRFVRLQVRAAGGVSAMRNSGGAIPQSRGFSPMAEDPGRWGDRADPAA